MYILATMTSMPLSCREIYGEEYQLDTIPRGDSKVVLDEKEKPFGAIDLKTLVDDLGHAGAFICIVYNGIGAAGHRFTELQIEIQRLGYDVTKLCDKFALTVSKFKKASATVLTDLQATYGFLLDNFEDMAVETLTNVSKIVGDMEKAAIELLKEFEEAMSKMTLFASKIEECRTEQNMAEVAAEALHETIGALKELSSVMIQVAMFWKQM